jgi:Mg/Co/Ni transporter MgtE
MGRADFAADCFGKAAPEAQFEMLGKSPDVTVALMGRASDALLAKSFKGLDAQSRVDVFERGPKPTQEAVLRTANVTAEAYSKMTVDEKSTRVIGRASDAEMAAMAKNLPPQERCRYFFEKADPACKSEFVALLDRADRFSLMGYAPEPMKADMERAYTQMEKTSRAQE